MITITHLIKPHMDDGDSKTHTQVKKKRTSSSLPKRHVPNVGTVLQSFWVRCRSVFSDIMDRKFMESQLRYVLYCGSILWIIFLLSQAF